MHQKKLQYLVKWKGYPNRVDWTWEPESNLEHSPEAIKDFHLSHPQAPRQLNANIWFHKIMKDNIPVFVLQRVKYLIGKMGFSNNTISDWDAHLNRGVMSWTRCFSLFFYLFLFFSFSFSTYFTSCSNGTLNPAYSLSWHTLPMAYSSFPILFRFTPQWVFCYWLAFYLITCAVPISSMSSFSM